MHGLLLGLALVGLCLGLGPPRRCPLRFRATRAHAEHAEHAAHATAELNEEQLLAVTAPVQHVRVHAGPGSGKTRVLVHRVAHLLQEEQIHAREILAVTFTRKAALEMKERIGALVGSSMLKKLTVCTLHSFCCMVLRGASSSRGGDEDEQDDGEPTSALNNLDGRFSIYDGDETKRLIKSIIVSEGGNLEKFPPSRVQECISVLKREGLTRIAEQHGGGGSEVAIRKVLATARARGLDLDPDLAAFSLQMHPPYQGFLRFSNARDFDDLVLDTLSFLDSSKPAAARIKSRYKHILVDEWQDVDKTQYALLARLATADNRNVLSPTGRLLADKSLFVVGDPNQTIYSWRGADAKNMDNFLSDFPTCLSFYLVRNYRSVPPIVAASRGVLGVAAVPNDEKPQAEAEAEAVQVVNSFKDESQAEFVARMAQYLLTPIPQASAPGQHQPTVAILYRRHNLSPAIESALILRGVKYVMYGGPGLLGRKSVKDLLSYLRLLLNPRDTEALRRTINFPARGVGSSTQEAFFDLAARVDRPVLDMLVELGEGKYKPPSAAAKKTRGKKKKGEEGGEEERSRGEDREPEVVSPVAESTERTLSTRQIKALQGAGAVFSELQHLTLGWTGSMEKLLADIMDVSGLRARAKQVLLVDEEERLVDAKLRKPGSRASVSASAAGANDDQINRELQQLLQLAREFEKDGNVLETSIAATLEGRLLDDDVALESADAVPNPPAARTIQLFLDMLQLHANEQEEQIENDDDGGEEDEVDDEKLSVRLPSKVRMMTLHAAKGLEFDHVMIVGLEEGNLPTSFRNAAGGVSSAAADGDDAVSGGGGGGDDEEEEEGIDGEELRQRFLEEERRLLYVGMTRAKSKLLMFYRSRSSMSNGGAMPLKPSRFLRDLPLSVPFVKSL